VAGAPGPERHLLLCQVPFLHRRLKPVGQRRRGLCHAFTSPLIDLPAGAAQWAAGKRSGWGHCIRTYVLSQVRGKGKRIRKRFQGTQECRLAYWPGRGCTGAWNSTAAPHHSESGSMSLQPGATVQRAWRQPNHHVLLVSRAGHQILDKHASIGPEPCCRTCSTRLASSRLCASPILQLLELRRCSPRRSNPPRSDPRQAGTRMPPALAARTCVSPGRQQGQPSRLWRAPLRYPLLARSSYQEDREPSRTRQKAECPASAKRIRGRA
jgi:hypothetical protein